MGHFTAPLLQPRVVAELVGLSPASLSRWDAVLLPAAAGRKPRRYSWAEVEILQRAVHQASGRGGTPAAFSGGRTAAHTAAPRNKPRRRTSRQGVVTVGLPRSAAGGPAAGGSRGARRRRRRERGPRH